MRWLDVDTIDQGLGAMSDATTGAKILKEIIGG
jgi:hypothetical protein